MALVLRDGMLASLDPPVVRSGHVGIEGDRIAWIGDSIPDGEHTFVDCQGKVVVPGNVCGHTHLYSALARGMPPPPRQPRNFTEILQFVWWPLDRALNEEEIRLSALVGALDAVRAGTTTLIDHHASPSFIDSSLDVLADSLGEVGVRSLLCYEVTDRNGHEEAEAGLGENTRFLRDNRRALARGMVGAHASFTLEDETLEALAGLAEETGAGVHIHVAEDMADEDDSLARTGKRVAYRLDAAGILRDNSLAAHGVHLDEGELSVLAGKQTWLAHNCRSNLNNSVGRAPIGRFGDRAVLGTDGIDGDMFAESRTAFFRAREDSLEAGAERFTGMLAAGGRLASEYFGTAIGRLEAGAAADLMILDYDPPTPLTEGNLAWHWAFAFSAALVSSVMVNGAWAMRDREILGVDEERVRAEARAAAPKLWERMAQFQ